MSGRNLGHIRATEHAEQLASGRITRQELIPEMLYSEEFRIGLGTRKGINSVSVGSDMVMEIPCLQIGKSLWLLLCFFVSLVHIDQ